MDQQDHGMRYEIDHTPVDVLAKDIRAPERQSSSELTNPHLMLRTERKSRLIVAASLSYDRSAHKVDQSNS
jgi:hypothetical protein